MVPERKLDRKLDRNKRSVVRAILGVQLKGNERHEGSFE